MEILAFITVLAVVLGVIALFAWWAYHSPVTYILFMLLTGGDSGGDCGSG